MAELKIPLIFDIKRCSMDDGEGIRTTVFLKGCPLRCQWCHNPESFEKTLEISFDSRKCIKCGNCISVCPNKAIKMNSEVRIDRQLCHKCTKCTKVCPTFALEVVGKYYSIDELIEIILRDESYYRTSGGGVTFSGGEPLAHMDYIGTACKRLFEKGISIAVQTSGFFDYSMFSRKVLPFIKDVYFDIKILDSKLHKQYTGVDNSLIIGNFENLVKESNIRLIPRTPLIPGITDTLDNLTAISKFLKELGINQHILLPYNDGGKIKYQRIKE